MSTYRDLSIHHRITAKGNALFFNYHYRITGGLLAKVVKKDPGTFCPGYPFYVIQTKTNHQDPTPYETRY